MNSASGVLRVFVERSSWPSGGAGTRLTVLFVVDGDWFITRGSFEGWVVVGTVFCRGTSAISTSVCSLDFEKQQPMVKCERRG